MAEIGNVTVRVDAVITDEQYREAMSAVKAANERMDLLEAENVKLRELVRDMYACIEALCSMVENSPGCSMCPTNQGEERPCASADVYCRMRELGVDA